MKKEISDIAQVFSLSRSGGSLKITLPKQYCDRLKLGPGHKLAVRGVGEECLLVGTIDSVYDPNGIIMTFRKEVNHDSEASILDNKA